MIMIKISFYALAFLFACGFALSQQNEYYYGEPPSLIPSNNEDAFCGTVIPSDMIGLSKNIKEGKQLFKANCATCHNKNMKSDMTGPALAGTRQRWAEYPKADLYNWIRNAQKMIAEEHPKAKEIWSEWKPTVMTNFPQLSDKQIESILNYIEVIHINKQ